MTEQAREPKIYGGESDAPECPPEAEFVLMFLGVSEIGWSKPFKEGDEPREQLVLAFKIDAENPQPGSLQEEWHHVDVRGWASPFLHYRPDLPGYTGQRYTEPNAYKLARALNGGTPLPMPTLTKPDTGEIYFAPYTARDAAAMLEPLVGRRFRSVVGPSASGWPRLKGDPMPMLTPTATRRRSASAAATEVVPEPALVGTGDAADDPFEGEDI